MTTNYPASLDNFPDPVPSDPAQFVWTDGTTRDTASGEAATILDYNANLVHATQHANLNDAVEALEARVGITGSADTSSLDYLINHIVAVPGFAEAAQDAIGAMVDSTLVYADATPLLTRGAITGDISIPQASNVSTLATVNGNVGSFGSSAAVLTITVNGKGLITAISTNAVIAPAGTLTGATLAANVVTSSLTAVGTIATGAWNGTAVDVLYGGTNLTSLSQGDIIYGSAANTFSKLAKSATATRYLSNTGTSNNPAWAQIDLSNGITGDLPFANLTQIAGLSILGVTGSSAADVAAISGTANQVLRVNSGGTSLAFGTVDVSSSSAVTGIMASTNGGTGNGFAKLSGPASSEKTFTLPNASAAILTDNAAVTAAQGGTGIASYAVGDILYASGSTTLSKLADIATGNTLISGGVTTAPSWGKVGLTTHISGTLAEGNGGTNQSTYTQGDLLYASAANTLSKLAKDTNSTRYLSNTGSSNNPAWAQVDLSNGVTGDLLFANLTQVSARSILGVTGNSTADVASIQGTANQVLVINSAGTALAFGQVNVASSSAVTGALGAANGGTGIANNAASTITISGNFATTLTVSGTTSLTLPTSGTVTTTSNKLSVFAATSSSELAGVISDETGSGLLVFGTAPTIAGGSITALTTFSLRDTSAAFDVTIAAASTTNLTAGRTLTIDMGNVAHTLNFGTTTGTLTFPTGTKTIPATADNLSVFAATTSAQLLGVISDETGTGALVFAGSPTFTGTPILSTASASNVTCTSSTIPAAGIYLPASNTLGLSARTLVAVSITNPASAVNYLTVTGAATAGAPTISVDGSDAAISLVIASKSTGAIGLFTNTTVRQINVVHTASAVNYLEMTGAVTTGPPYIAAVGTDSNIDLWLVPKGTTGLMRMSSFIANGAINKTLGNIGPTGSSTTVQEWFALKNAAGTTRYIPAF